MVSYSTVISKKFKQAVNLVPAVEVLYSVCTVLILYFSPFFLVPSSSKYDSSKVDIADDPTQDDHEDIIKLLNLTAPTLQDLLPPESDLELSSHSKKSSTLSAYTISQGSVKPTFSHFSPTRAKNARYSNDEWSNKAKSTDSASSGGESGLVGKPINQLSLNSSSEHNYSDNFDSLASEQSDN